MAGQTQQNSAKNLNIGKEELSPQQLISRGNSATDEYQTHQSTIHQQQSASNQCNTARNHHGLQSLIPGSKAAGNNSSTLAPGGMMNNTMVDEMLSHRGVLGGGSHPTSQQLNATSTAPRAIELSHVSEQMKKEPIKGDDIVLSQEETPCKRDFMMLNNLNKSGRNALQ